MAEIRDYDVTAANNNSSPPDGAPEGQLPSTVNDTIREIMARLKREWSDRSGVNTTAGTSNAYTLAASQTITAYAAGDVFMFIADRANTGAATLAVDGLAAKSLVSNAQTALVANQIVANGIYVAAYDATNDTFQVMGVTDTGGALTLTSLSTDTINEKTAAAGVTVDGVLLKDGGAVFADGATIEVDTVNEATAAAGVTVDGVLLKDGGVTATSASSITASSGTALRVTNTGSGDSLLVEDSASPDSTPFVITSNGTVGLGTTAPSLPNGVGPIVVSEASAAYGPQSSWRNTASDATAGYFHFEKSRSGGLVSASDVVGTLSWRAHDGVDFRGVATISALTGATPAAGDTPGILYFATTAEGNTSSTERMRIDSSGRVIVGSTASQSVGDNTGTDTETSLQLHGTTQPTSSMTLGNWSATGTSEGSLIFARSKSGTVGTDTVLADGDNLGSVAFSSPNVAGTAWGATAQIFCEVDGTPSTYAPGRLSFFTSDGSAATSTERMRIQSDGDINLLGDVKIGGAGGDPPNARLDVVDDLGVTAAAHLVAQVKRSTGNFRGLNFGYIADGANDTDGYIASNGSTALRLGHNANISTTTPTLYLSGTGAVGMGNSSPAAKLHVTNTGSGDSFLVEDSANPDSDPFVITSLGNIVKGHTTNVGGYHHPQGEVDATPATQIHGDASTKAQIALTSWSASDPSYYAPAITLAKSSSATVGTKASGLVSGEDLGSLVWSGDDGTSFIKAAMIQAEVDGTPGVSDMPGRLTFSTTADGAATPTERMRIDSAGNVGIGTAAPSERLHVSGTGETMLVTPVTYANNQDSSYLIAAGTSYDGVTSNWGAYGFQHRIKSDAGGTGRVTIDTYNGEVFCVNSSDRVGIGVSSPDGKLHVHSATAGAIVASNDADEVVVENSGSCGISLLAPDAQNTNIYFGSPTDSVGAYLRWNYDADLLKIATDKSGAEMGFYTGASTAAMRIDREGRSLFHTAASRAVGGTAHGVQIESAATSSGASLSINRIANDASGAYLSISKQRTDDNTGAIQSGDNLGQLRWCGSDGTSATQAVAEMRAYAGSTWTGSNRETELRFYTVASGSTALNQNMTLSGDGNLGIGLTAPTEKLDVNGDAIRVRTSQTPASASATGDAGQICWDANYIYVCTATNTWKRAALATW